MCWVPAPSAERLPPLVTTAGRMACSACQFVTSTSGRVTQVKSAGRVSSRPFPPGAAR